ncbi:MAG: hypothetical protein D6770_08555 [Anaerolineae bacterium]|nr:MAG: hypothetical protein D6770_08555 [Anaerolineae bacterium]
MNASFEWLMAGVLGAVVGSAEIISRYRDEPDDALRTWPSLFYLLVNALAAILALGIIRVFGWTFGLSNEEGVRWAQVLAAGVGAMALLRASLFNVRVGEQNVPIGLNRFLDALLAAVDRAVDRRRAQERAVIVSETMRDIAFEKAYQALPAYCFALLQNLPQDEQERFGKKIALLRGADMSPRLKSLLLGLGLLNLVGEKVLKTAVQHLGDEIKVSPSSEQEPEERDSSPHE